jgi:hypothetical protein
MLQTNAGAEYDARNCIIFRAMLDNPENPAAACPNDKFSAPTQLA